MKKLENRFINIDQNDIDSVVYSIGCNELSGMATVVKTYEHALENHFHVNHALAVSSGTSALHLLLYMYDVKSGDEIILPSSAPIMSVLPILAVNATPVFCDNNKDDFSFDIRDLKNKITTKTKAVITVPMWGYPTSEEELYSYLKSEGIPLINDASHAHGSRVNDKYIGTVCDVSFFSTQERKLVSTGEGGFILTDEEHIANRIKEIRDFGKPFREGEEWLSRKNQYGYLFGLNFRLPAMSAALGITQLNKLDDKIKVRVKNGDLIRSALSSISWLTEVEYDKSNKHNHYSLVFKCSHETLTAKEIGKVLSDNNIISDTYRFDIKPLYELPILEIYKSNCPNSERILKEIITLPVHEGMSTEDIDRVINTLRNIDSSTPNDTQKRVYVFDLDDTAVLSNEKSSPTDELVDILNKNNDTAHFSVATGRSWHHAKDIIRKLNITNPCIISGGTQIIDPVNETLLWERKIEHEDARLIFELAKQYNKKISYVDGLNTQNIKEVDEYQTHIQANTVYLLNINQDEADEVLNKLSSSSNLHAAITKSWINTEVIDLHITHKNATKGAALEQLAKRQNYNLDDLIAIGDGLNDIDFLKKAGFKVAMGNAEEELKMLADKVIGLVTENGLAKFFEEEFNV